MGGAAKKTALRGDGLARETDALVVKRSVEHAAGTGTETFNWW
jgi:hypothetical protein